MNLSPIIRYQDSPTNAPPASRAPRAKPSWRDRLKTLWHSLEVLARAIWVRLLWLVRKRLVWALAPVCMVALMAARFETSAEPRVSTYYVQTPEKISGEKEQDEALAGLPEAIVTRVEQMVSAMDHLFVKVPAQEQYKKGEPLRSVIRLQGGQEVASLGGLPVDHFFMEWLPALAEDEQKQAKLMLDVVAGPMPKMTRGTQVRVQLTRDAVKGEEVSFSLTVLLDKQAYEKKLDADPTTKRVSLSDVADGVASCLLVHHLERRVEHADNELREALWNKMRPFQQSTMKSLKYFRNIYEAIVAIKDIDRQTNLFVGLERYSFFARTWQEQPTDAKKALQEAKKKIIKAAGEDVAAGTSGLSSPLPAYLFVHVTTASHIGIPERAGKAQDVERDPAIETYAAHAFSTYPYKCAKWAQAMALRLGSDSSKVPKHWEEIAEKKWPDCYGDAAQKPSAEKLDALSKLAEAQVASAYSNANQLDEAIKKRRNSVARALGEKGGAHDSQISRAETLLEGGIDAIKIYHMAAPHHEAIRVTQRLATYAEQDMRSLRDSIDALVEGEEDARFKELRVSHKNMEARLKKCTTDPKACKTLRDDIDKWLTDAMRASHQLAMSCFDKAITTLSDMRDNECKKEKELVECSEANSGPKGFGAKGAESDPKPQMFNQGFGAKAGEDGADAESDDKDQGRKKIRSHLVQVNDILALAEAFRTLQACQAPWITPIDLNALVEQTADVRARSPLASVLDAALARCALIHAAMTTTIGQTLIKQNRSEKLLEAWSWAPPEPSVAFEQERFLLQNNIHMDPGDLARLHYPGTWDAIRKVAAAKWKPDVRKLNEMLAAVQTSIVKKEPWNGASRRQEMWTWAMTGKDGKDHTQDLKEAMAAVGKELLRDALRHEVKKKKKTITCREILALIRCGKEPLPADLPAECAHVSEQRCPVDVEKAHYDSLGDPNTPEALKEMGAMASNTAAAFNALWNQLGKNLENLLEPFLAETNNAASKNDLFGDAHTLPFMILRIAAVSREMNGLRAMFTQIGPKMPEKMATRLAERYEENPYDYKASSLRKADIIEDLQQTTPFTANKRIVESEQDAIDALDNAKLTRCWPNANDAGKEHLQKRWLRRFLSHVALHQDRYYRNDPIDRVAFGTLDLATSYQTWCEWTSDGTWPLVIDEEVLALTWIWQQDEVGEKETDKHFYVRGDDLPDYLVARGLMERGNPDGNPDDALHNPRGLDSAEGASLRARAAVRAGNGGLAVKFANDAKMFWPGDKNAPALLEANLMQTAGDASLLLGTLVTGKNGWGSFYEASQNYHGQETHLAKRRRAAAFIEMSQAHEAALLLRGSSCWKDKWLLAIANRILGSQRANPFGELEEGEKMFTVEDLPLTTGNDECNEPVFIGPIIKQYGRLLVRENR